MSSLFDEFKGNYFSSELFLIVRMGSYLLHLSNIWKKWDLWLNIYWTSISMSVCKKQWLSPPGVFRNIPWFFWMLTYLGWGWRLLAFDGLKQAMDLDHRLDSFSVKGETVNILGFLSHVVSIQLCHCSVKVVKVNKWV